MDPEFEGVDCIELYSVKKRGQSRALFCFNLLQSKAERTNLLVTLSCNKVRSENLSIKYLRLEASLVCFV